MLKNVPLIPGKTVGRGGGGGGGEETAGIDWYISILRLKRGEEIEKISSASFHRVRGTQEEVCKHTFN